LRAFYRSFNDSDADPTVIPCGQSAVVFLYSLITSICDERRAVLLLGIITRLGAHPSHALTRPSVIVAFTKQVLSNLSIAKRPELPKASPAGESRGLSLKDLHIVPDGARKDSDSDVEDSDDEPEDNDDEPEDGSETHVAHGAVRLLHAVLAGEMDRKCALPRMLMGVCIPLSQRTRICLRVHSQSSKDLTPCWTCWRTAIPLPFAELHGRHG
jgi:hypothetical protein